MPSLDPSSVTVGPRKTAAVRPSQREHKAPAWTQVWLPSASRLSLGKVSLTTGKSQLQAPLCYSRAEAVHCPSPVHVVLFVVHLFPCIVFDLWSISIEVTE